MSGFDLIIEPDPSEPEAAEVLVDAMVGDRKYRFLLDTGSAATTIGFDEYTAKFDTLGRSTSSGVFAAQSDDLVKAPRIELGPIERHDFTVVRMQPGREGHSLIGMDLLAGSALQFLFSEKRVDVGEPSIGDEETTNDLVLGEKSHPYVDVSFGESVAAAVWDTGAGVTVVDSAFIEANSDHFQAAGWSEGTDSTGTHMKTQMFVMSAAEIGGKTFPAHRVAAVDLSYVNSTTEIPMDLILGYSSLSKANWLFDFSRKRWGVSGMLGSP